MVTGTTLLASASSNGTISANTVAPEYTTFYWNGSNGCNVANGGQLIMKLNFDNSYTNDTGYLNVDTPAQYWVNISEYGASASMTATMPSTSLWKAFVTNDTSVPMHVTSGTLQST